jgi:hypothetical protein
LVWGKNISWSLQLGRKFPRIFWQEWLLPFNRDAQALNSLHMSKLDNSELNMKMHPVNVFAQLCQAASPNIAGLKITAYADFLQHAAREVVEQLVKEDKTLRDNLKVVFLAGAAANGSALPFYNLVENQPLPEKTFTLWQLIYTWLFIFAAKPVAVVAETRFLDADLSSTVDLNLWLRDPDKIDHLGLTNIYQDRFKVNCGFLPKISLVLHDVADMQDLQLMPEVCIYGHRFLAVIFQEMYGSVESMLLHPSFAAAVDKMAADLSGIEPQYQTVDQVFINYLQIRDFPETSICLDWLPATAKSDRVWHKQNENFFNHILGGHFDEICVEDITKQLHDNRNVKKKNQFTIVKVNGLIFESQFLPATHVVMKLRGFSSFRGDINNWLDILKEYMSYIVLHTEIGCPVDYLLQTGPLLLTCEKLNLPLHGSQKQRLIGIFLEEIAPHEDRRIFSSRVKFLTDYWLLDKTTSRILSAAEDAGFIINKSSLRKNIRKIATNLLANKLRVDYCDIAIILDRTGQILTVKLYDFERTSFQELVSEQHIILDVIIDLKRRLDKAHWVNTLEYVFSPIGLGGVAQLNNMNQYLLPRNHKRTWMYNLLWVVRSTIFIPGKTVGDWLWRHIFRLIAEISSRGYQLTS